MPDLTGWPTDGAEGSVSSEARWRAMAKLWAPSGVVAGYLGVLVPSLSGGVITVQPGGAWIDGHYAEILGSSTFPSTVTGLVVIRFTPADNHFEMLYRDGATTPTQTEATWELPIAKVTSSALSDVRAVIHGTSPVGFSATGSGVNSRAPGTWHSFVPGTIVWMTGNWTRLSSGFVCPPGAGGVYALEAQVSWATNNSGRRGLQIFRGGTSEAFMQVAASPQSSSILNISAIARVNVGNELSVQVLQDSGGALDQSTTTLAAIRVAD